MSGSVSSETGLRRILVVDDNPELHADFARVLSHNVPGTTSHPETLSFEQEPDRRFPVPRYEPHFAFHGQEALRKVREAVVAGTPFDAAFVDMRMPPGWDGLRTVEAMWEVDPELHVVICTAWSDRSGADISRRLGRSDQYLILRKPFDPLEVVQMASTLAAKRQLHRMQQTSTRELEQTIRSHTAAVFKAHEETIHLLIRASLHRDAETGNHIKRVGLFSARLARAAGLPQKEVDLIRLAAPMHDVGKIGIPDSVLRKPGPLTPEERRVMETHTTIGAAMLSGSESPMLRKAREIALSHHERWDGCGYPHRVAADDIPISARIVAIADVYDALTQNRVYRAALPEPKVLEIMEAGRDAHFDPELLDLTLTLIPDFRLIAAVHPDQIPEPHSVPENGDTATAADSDRSARSADAGRQVLASSSH